MQHELRLSKQPGLVSTLLLAGSHHKKLRRKIAGFGDLDLYLAFLLTRYGRLARSRRIRAVRTLYQKRNLELRALKFRPSDRTWLKLGLLARHAGVSRCWMFVFLFLQDLRRKERTVTTIFRQKLRMLVYAEFLDQVQLIWRRSLREKPPERSSPPR